MAEAAVDGSRTRTAGGSPWRSADILILLTPAWATLLLHLLTAKGYGLCGDELYYLACSDHLDWGYVDQPPLSLLLLHLVRMFFGNSLLAIRLLPALAGFFTLLLTGLLARRMGAGLFGQMLAQICALAAPLYLAVDHIFSMNAFDVLFWLAALYLFVCILEGGHPRLWVWFGLVAGLGLQNKISVLFLCFGLFVGLLVTLQRRLLVTPWILAGALVAVVLISPNVVWQVSHGFPTLEWVRNARSQKMAALSLPAFLVGQIILMQPLTLLVWGTGLLALLLHPRLRGYRPLGWCYLAVFALFVVQGGKPYYLGPIYPVLFAAGAIVIERWVANYRIRAGIIAVLVAGGALTAPMTLPLLPVDTFIRYSEVIGMRPASGERYAEGKLPSFYANMFGWDKMVGLVNAVYRSLPAHDQAKCGIVCQNYMQAGAVDFYGREYGLPYAISGHNNYWLWGLRGYSGEVMIVLGGDAGSLKEIFQEVVEAGRFNDPYIQPIHTNMPVFVVRKPKTSPQALWPRAKSYL